MDQCTSQGMHLTFRHNRLWFYFYKWYVKYSQSDLTINCHSLQYYKCLKTN